MNTLFIIWFSMANGVATDSVQSKDFESLSDCETYAAVEMQNARAESYLCLEGYSLTKKK